MKVLRIAPEWDAIPRAPENQRALIPIQPTAKEQREVDELDSINEPPKPFDPPEAISVADLRTVLAYSRQHINVITTALHKALPELWPAHLSDPDEFYASYIRTVEGREFREMLAALQEVRKRRISWTNIVVGTLRIGYQAYAELARDPRVSEAERDELLDFSDALAALDRLGETAHHRAYDWLMNAVDREFEPEGTDWGEAPASGSGSLDDQWQEQVEALDEAVSDLFVLYFDEDALAEVQSRVDALQALVQRYEEVEAQQRSDLVERTLAVAERLEDSLANENKLTPAIERSLQQLRAALEDEPEVVAEIWAEKADGLLEALSEAESAIETVAAAIERAHEADDDDALATGYASRKEARAHHAGVIEQLAGHAMQWRVDAAEVGTGEPPAPEATESPEAPTAAPPSVDGTAEKADSPPVDEVQEPETVSVPTQAPEAGDTEPTPEPAPPAAGTRASGSIEKTQPARVTWSYEEFLQGHWQAPDGHCRTAPWLDATFTARLRKFARPNVSAENLTIPYLASRALVSLGATPLADPVDVQDLANLLEGQQSSRMDEDRVERLRGFLESAEGRDAALVAVLLEILRPSDAVLLPEDVTRIQEVIRLSSEELRGFINGCAECRKVGVDAWAGLSKQLRSRGPHTAGEWKEALSTAREEFGATFQHLRHNVGGKVQRTHCRKAWNQFIEEWVEPLASVILPSAAGDDSKGWELRDLDRQARRLPDRHHQVADRGGARYIDREKMDRAAAELSTLAMRVIEAARGFREASAERQSHSMPLPLDEVRALVEGPELTDPLEELCRAAIRVELKAQPAAPLHSVLSVTEADFWQHPDLLPLVSGAENMAGKWRKAVPADEVNDPVRATAVLLQSSANPGGEVPEDVPGELRERLRESRRPDLLLYLVGSGGLDSSETAQIHSEEVRRAEELTGDIEALKGHLRKAIELALPEGTAISDAVERATRFLDERTRLSLEMPIIREWIAGLKAHMTEVCQQGGESLRHEAAALPDEAQRQRVEQALAAGRYAVALRCLHERDARAAEEGESSRVTTWRTEAVDRYPDPLAHLQGVQADDPGAAFAATWSKRAFREHEEARQLRRAFYDLISGETPSQPPLAEGLRDIKPTQITINCPALLGLFQQERLNPTFVPQLLPLRQLHIVTPDKSVSPTRYVQELPRQATAGGRGEGVSVFLIPGITRENRNRILEEARRRNLNLALVDDVDACRLHEATSGRQNGFLAFAEIVLEQLRLTLSPFDPRDGQYVAVETYVGRAQQAEDLAHSARFTRVFSGRKLGKSALLRYVQHRYDASPLPSGNTLHVLFIIAAGGHSESWMSRSILDQLKSRFSFEPSEEGEDDPGQWLMANLARFFEQHPGISLLIIVDESDAFVEGQIQCYDERRERCMSFRMLKESPGGQDSSSLPRVRFVFSGYRVTASREGAFANAGEVLRLAPLTEDEATQLIEAPLARMGIDAREVAPSISRLCGFQPAVLIRFGNTLLQHLQRRLTTAQRDSIVVTADDVTATYHQGPVREEIRTVVDNNFQGNRCARVVFWTLLEVFNGMLPGQGLADAHEVVLEHIRAIDPDTAWLRALDPTETGEIRRHLMDFAARHLLVETREGGHTTYRLKFPNHLPLLLTEGDPANQIRQDIERVRSSGQETMLFSTILPTNSMDEIHFACGEEGRSVLGVRAVVAGFHWVAPLVDDRGGLPDRLGYKPEEVVAASRVGDALDQDRLMVLDAAPATAEMLVTRRDPTKGVPVLIGGVDVLRWALTQSAAADGLTVEQVGMNRVGDGRIAWWFERLRALHFERRDGLGRITRTTSGIPLLVGVWDHALSAGHGGDVDLATFDAVEARFGEALREQAQALVRGPDAVRLTPREIELMRMIATVACNSSGTFRIDEELRDAWDELYKPELMPAAAAAYRNSDDGVALDVLRLSGLVPMGPNGRVTLSPDDALFQIVAAIEALDAP